MNRHFELGPNKSQLFCKRSFPMKNHAQRLFQRSFHRPGFPMLVLTATAMCLFAPPAFNQTVEPLTPPAASTVANLPAVPKLIKFSGIALDGRGYPITVPVEATFALYAQQGAESSAAIWHETQRISPNEKGAYTAYLGATQGLPAEVFYLRRSPVSRSEC
jgi:hypothetical protein